MRDTFRAKLLICFAITAAGLAVFALLGGRLISLYLHDTGDAVTLESTLWYARRYLRIMMVEMIPFAVIQAYSGTLRETGETVLPMKAGITAVFVNLILNYILIFGKFGAPVLGVEGAAIATTVSRFVELFIVAGWTHRHKEAHPFIDGAYRNLKIPAALAAKIIVTGAPLMLNEALWSFGQAILVQCYSVRGLGVVAAFNISSTISNVFNVAFIAMGNAVGIIVGQLLGAGKLEEAKDTDRKLIFFSTVSCAVIGTVMALFSPLFPALYNTSDDIRRLAARFIVIASLYMPMHAFINAAYFTLRCGGKTLVTFFFDSVYVWLVNIPLAYVLSRYTGLHIIFLFFACQFIDIVKCIIGFILVKKGVWMNIIVKG